MKTLIIPTDFSAPATNAMNYAVDMAKEINASVLLFHVYQIPVSMTEVPVVMVSVEELKHNAEQKLEELKKNIEHLSSGGIKVYTEARLGNTIDELADICEQIKPFAVVMGSKGAAGIERVLFGSTTLTAIRHLTWPVIAVPPGKEYKSIKKIGFACDFKKVVQSTPTDFIKEMVEAFDAELHVLNVNLEHSSLNSEKAEESLMLQTMLSDLKPEYHFITAADVENGLNEFAETNNLDLVITIPKKHTLVDGIFKKSHTKHLVFESHVPIMCVHE